MSQGQNHEQSLHEVKPLFTGWWLFSSHQPTDEGKILLISFAYEDGKYAIKVIKGEGTIDVE